MPPAITSPPAGKVIGSMLSDSTLLSPLVNIRPMARNGAAAMLTTTFFTTVQMASPRSAFHVARGPDIGRLIFRSLLASVMSATMRPSGSPMRFLTSSSCRDGATWMSSMTISFEASS
jgi:hypothetical protein